MSLQPLRRDPALVPLSHDHHEGLIAAVRLKGGRSAIRAESDPYRSIRILWDEDLEPHFEQEERVLFQREWPDVIISMVRRALDEHDRMRSMVVAVQEGKGTTELLKEFGALLESHIRFEERELFGAMQDALTSDELAAIAGELVGMREVKRCRTRGEQ